MNCSAITLKIQQHLWLDLRIARSFGFSAAFLTFLKSTFFRKNAGLGQSIEYKKYENIKKRIGARYADIISKYASLKETADLKLIAEDAPIWFFWWQGINADTPQTVIDCLNTIQRHKEKHEVIVLSKNNLQHYVSLPDIFLQRLKSHNYNLTHFSDIVRTALLYDKGGIWLDATIYLINSLPDEMYTLPYYTVKHGLYANFHVCKGLWSSFFLASGPKNPFFAYMREMYKQYWEDTDFLLCYLLTDVFIALGYERIPLIRSQIDQVPYNNSHIFWLAEHADDSLSNVTIPALTAKDSVFKMRWSVSYTEQSKDLESTVYGKFKKDSNSAHLDS